MKTWFEKGELAWQKYVCYAIDGDDMFDNDETYVGSPIEDTGECHYDEVYVHKSNLYWNLLRTIEKQYGIKYACPQHKNDCKKCERFANKYSDYYKFEIKAIANLPDVDDTLRKIENQRTKTPCYIDAIHVLEGVGEHFDWNTTDADVIELIDLYHLQWLKDNRSIILYDIKPFIEKFEKCQSIAPAEDTRFHNAINKVCSISFYTPLFEDSFKRNLRYYLNNTQSDINLNWIDTSKIADMSNLFSGLYYFKGDISKWDVSNVTEMKGMFKDCAEFNCDISKWNVEKVENMDEMFYGCLAFNQDIKQWNVSNVKTKHNVFKCSGICDKFNPFVKVVTINTVCNCDTEHLGFADLFDQEIYDVGNGRPHKQSTEKHGRAYCCLKEWLGEGDYSYYGVIYGERFQGALDLYFSGDWCDDRFNCEQEIILKNIYDNMSFIQGDFKAFVDNFEKRITMPDGLEENFYTYVQCKDFFVGFYRPSGEDFINNLRHYLQNADANVNLNWIDTSKLTDISNLFSGLYYFNGDISQWDVSNVTNMEGMFEGCVEFDGDLSDWAINENTRTVNMFRLCGIDDDNKPKMK